MRQPALAFAFNSEERAEVLLENYRFLVGAGIRSGEALAKRLGFPGVAGLDRYLYRRREPIRHHRMDSQAPMFNASKFDHPRWEAIAAEVTPQQRLAAFRVASRYTVADDDVIDKLGLSDLQGHEQLAS